MTIADELLQEAAAEPAAIEPRKRLADALRADGENELGDVVEGRTGSKLLEAARKLSEETGLHLGVRLLWCAHHVMPRLVTRQTTQVGHVDFQQPMTVPDSDDQSAPLRVRRPPWVRWATTVENSPVSSAEQWRAMADVVATRLGR